MKTNKSYAKRLKVTKNGKIVARASGHCHFNARDNAKTRGAKGRTRLLKFNRLARSRFLSNVA
jgi:ribosomal protein L35